MRAADKKLGLRFAIAKWLAVVSQLLFLTVLVPAHERGAMRVDGKRVGEGTAKVEGCCNHSGKKETPTEGDRKACAICFMTAQLDTASAATVEAPLPKLSGVAEAARVESSVSLWRGAVYNGRAPPV